MNKRKDRLAKRYGRAHCALLTVEEIADNILRIWHSATPSQLTFNWYKEANLFAQYLAEAYDFSVPAAAAIISALSPQNKWERNQIDAESVCAALEIGLKIWNIPVSTYNVNKFKAAEVAYQHRKGSIAEIVGIFKGLKTRSFFINIAIPDDPYTVTVDFHAYGVAVAKRYASNGRNTVPSIGKADYTKVADAYRLAAQRLSVPPSKVQAVTWVVWRNRKIGQFALSF